MKNHGTILFILPNYEHFRPWRPEQGRSEATSIRLLAMYELRTEQRPSTVRLDPNRINPERCGFFSDSSGLGSSRVTLNVSRLPTWIHRALTPDIVCSKLSVLSTGNINERPIRLHIVSQLETVCPSRWRRESSTKLSLSFDETTIVIGTGKRGSTYWGLCIWTWFA